MILASLQLDFFGTATFPWWAAVTGPIALALLLFAWFGRHAEDRGHRIFNLPVPAVSGILGALTLLLTALLLVLPTPRLLPLLFTGSIAAVTPLIFYQHLRQLLGTPRVSTLLTLRIAGLLLLLLLLFQPVLAFIKDPNSKPVLAIVIDASGSMSVSDQPNEPSRYRQAVLATQTLASRLQDKYTIQPFAYDDQHKTPLPDIAAFDAIGPTGETTDLPAALSLATATNPAHIILFSDGIHNGPATIDAGIRSITVPVHTVRVGSDALEPSTVPDIAVVSVEAPSTATVNTTVTLNASIKSTALSDRTVRVLLLDGDTQLDEQRLVLRSGPTPQSVKLKFVPTKVGRAALHVQVPVDPAERSAANNRQDVPILITDPKLPVLYVEGRVRPEVGPLRRALEQDPNITAITMVQTVAGRFEIRGLKPGDDLHGLPTTAAQWNRFKVIILGDLDASFLSFQQQSDLAQAVRDGAGLMMIGGQRSFGPGNWQRTPIAEVLPVDVSPQTPPQINSGFVPQLTAFGSQHSILKNIATYFLQADGTAGAQQLPQLSGCVALGSAKPGATVLLTHPTAKVDGQPAIVLAVEQIGKGRSAAFAADTTWRWSLFLRAAGKDSPYFRFWGQSVRWLANQEDLKKATGASVTSMLPKERYESGETITLRAAVTDKDGQSTAFATVDATITPPGNTPIPLHLLPVTGDVGMYEATFQPKQAGNYSVAFTATKDGITLGTDQSKFTVAQAAGEFDVLAASPATLQSIAKLTGGTYSELTGINALADRLAASLPPAALAQRTNIPLYHTRGFFLLFIASMSAEWVLRRRWQLQ